MKKKLQDKLTIYMIIATLISGISCGSLTLLGVQQSIKNNNDNIKTTIEQQDKLIKINSEPKLVYNSKFMDYIYTTDKEVIKAETIEVKENNIDVIIKIDIIIEDTKPVAYIECFYTYQKDYETYLSKYTEENKHFYIYYVDIENVGKWYALDLDLELAYDNFTEKDFIPIKYKYFDSIKVSKSLKHGDYIRCAIIESSEYKETTLLRTSLEYKSIYNEYFYTK